jgi:nicotinate-nucleotide adenylyltransferase
MLPIVVVDRLGPSLYAAASPAGASLAKFRIAEENAASLPNRRPPVWSFLHGLKSPLSSTALRAIRREGGSSRPTAKAGKTAQSKSAKKRRL